MIHPGIKPALAVPQSFNVFFQIMHGFPVLAGSRREPIFFGTDHEIIHGLVDPGVEGFGVGKPGELLVQNDYRTPGYLQNSQLKIVDIIR
jgi:hypothetical protein